MYELGKEEDIECIGADRYTMFLSVGDHTLWYWNSGTIKYHDNKDALADPELCNMNYSGKFEKVDIKEVLGIEEEETIPGVIDICAGSENILFLTNDGQVFISEYVTSEIKDVDYYNMTSTNPNRAKILTVRDLALKEVAFQKLDWKNIISINTNGGYLFSAVDVNGKYFYLDMTAMKGQDLSGGLGSAEFNSDFGNQTEIMREIQKLKQQM